MAERRCPGGVFEAVDEHTCRLRTGADSLEWLALSLGMLGVDFDIQEPPELVDHVATLARRYGRSAAVTAPV
jgi:predicted DNA-binding transcriptional regulator YafY